MTWFEEVRAENLEKWKEMLDEYISKEIARIINEPEKEATTMQAEYKGFTGELVKLEQCVDLMLGTVYSLSIYDSEKNVTISADCVKLSDVKFLGGAVSFS